MKNFSVIVLSAIGIFFLILNINGDRIKRPLENHEPYNQEHTNSHKIKIISYVLKTNNKIELIKVPAKNLKFEPFKNWIAKGLWENENHNSTGWSILEIETNENADDYDQAFAAGLLEGELTRELISLHILNTIGDYCPDTISMLCNKSINFLIEHFKWIKSQIDKHKDDPYWHQVNLIFAQFNGLYYGYNQLNLNHKQEDVLEQMIKNIQPFLNLIALQLMGDRAEIEASLTGLSDPFISGSCSALIKILPENKDIYISHVSWTHYEWMIRILKHFKLNFHLNKKDSGVIPGSEVSFSSYPGILTSIDDFYVLKSKLNVLETSIGNSNVDLWKYVQPNSNLYWIRCLIANRLSFFGSDWAKWFSMYNSGTYNNQWMIVDLKQFYPGEPLKDGLLTVLEQIPNKIEWQDKTDMLRSQSYWPSYNIPYFKNIYNQSGMYDAYLKYGDYFSYENSSRSNIFDRDNSKVVDIDSMIKLMRYNDFVHDPYSRCECDPPYSGNSAISSRSDLSPSNGKYPFEALGHRDHGGIDMKLTNWKMAQTFDFIGISGPTFSENIPPFVWSQVDFGNTTNHFGQPDKWTFGPFYTNWKF